jgi:beta-phosphoglucomutase-like phosphatase (HAD superfamily)
MTHPHYLSMKTVPELETLKAAYPGLQTILFDMDGTLFDTEKYHTMALQSIGEEQSIIPPFDPKELHEMMMGKADHLLFELIKDWPGFPAHWTARDFVNEKNRHLLNIIKNLDGKSYISEGIEKLLSAAKLSNIQLGLVTSSEKIITKELLALSGLTNYFEYILTRDDSLKVKPDPWPYLTALTHFNAQPETTIVFEDSYVGLEAAAGAGVHVIKAEWY